MTAQLALDLFPTLPAGPGVYAWTWEGSEYRGRIAAWAATTETAPCWLRLEVLWRDGEPVSETQVHRGMVRWPELAGTWK